MLAKITTVILRDGYAFVAAPDMQALLRESGLRDWESFAQSWDDLGRDLYMTDGGRYRRRRHAGFSVSANGIFRKPHQPHYQSRDYNPLNGGIERWFEPVTDAVAAHPALIAILRASHALFDSLTAAASPARPWHVEVHQFRIEAQPNQKGHPTPEGMHRDGVDWVLVLLVARKNIAQGTTTIYDIEKRPVGSFTLATPFDSVFVDDHRVYHGVTPVEPADQSNLAVRDVLVVTFRREHH
jgi:hypothetical protein